MPNIQFNYLYRDGANYKNYGFVIFENDTQLSLKEIELLITDKLIDQTWFYCDEWQLTDLHFNKWSNQTDHTFHEFDGLAPTGNAINANMTLSTFLKIVAKTDRYGFAHNHFLFFGL